MIFSFRVTHSSSVRASKQHKYISTDLCVVPIKMVLSKNLIDWQLVNERARDELMATKAGKLFHHLLLTRVGLENERVFACSARPAFVVSIYLIGWRTRRRNLQQVKWDEQEIRSSSSSGDIYSRKKRIREQRIEKWNTGGRQLIDNGVRKIDWLVRSRFRAELHTGWLQCLTRPVRRVAWREGDRCWHWTPRCFGVLCRLFGQRCFQSIDFGL